MVGGGGGDRTLWLWSTLPEVQEEDQTWRRDGDAVENVNRLHLAGHANGSFTQARSGTRKPHTVQHDVELLGRIADLVRPGGKITIAQAVSSGEEDCALRSPAELLADARLAGLLPLSPVRDVEVDDATAADIRKHLDFNKASFRVVELSCRSPDFEQGSSQPLPFAAKATKQKLDVWNIEGDDDDVDLLDPDSLIDEQDLKKPDAASLRVCGTKARKACKDCSCGLAEELADGKEPTTKRSVNSSCGSCYLGDAFRCASCPYLGMPAFKPGEKIQLSDRQLKPDK